MKLLSVVGARPNFMKIAPFVHALERHNKSVPRHKRVQHILVHTGQHYDSAMSGTFFTTLDIPPPEHNLEVGSGSHGYQMGTTMIAFERVLLAERPDWVIVIGDVNATAACAMVAKKHQVNVAHIEAGLRSHDWTMPEEINRVVTDRLSDLLLTTCPFADANLAAEGVPPTRIVRVGNIMIDTLEAQRSYAERLDIDTIVRVNAWPDPASAPAAPAKGWAERPFGVVTMHRPSNVDDEAVLRALVTFFTDEVSRQLRLLWPLHPRAAKQLTTFGLWPQVAACGNLQILQPLGYRELLKLNMHAGMVFTDSGGLQEECCVLGTPCITMRWNTERPLTLSEHGGVSRLVGNDVGSLRQAYLACLETHRKVCRPPLWDGATAPRILHALLHPPAAPAVDPSHLGVSCIPGV